MPFPPIYDSSSQVLILGSFPSVKSRQYGFYYMNPHNRFWKLLAVLINPNFISTNIDEKKQLLLQHHIALYDVIGSCIIQGSSDSSIQQIVPNDIMTIINNSRIKHIILNGQKAYQEFCRYYPNLISTATLMPSTSPANAASNFDKLISSWQKIKEFI